MTATDEGHEAHEDHEGHDAAHETRQPAAVPPIVDREAWQAARDELLVREKAHMRAGDAIAAARRRLPMTEVDGGSEKPNIGVRSLRRPYVHRHPAVPPG